MFSVWPVRAHAMIRFFLPAAALLIAGCSGSDPRGHQVQGSVTYEGKPVPAGTIQFVPAKGNSGPPAFAKIVDGHFDTAAPGGKGTVGGPHQATVNGFDGKADPAKELPVGNPLFLDYHVDVDFPPQDTTMDIVVDLGDK